MLGLCRFIFATFPHEKFFTVTVNVTVTVVPPTFWNLAKNWKSIILGQKYFKLRIFFKTYMKVWVLRHTFLKEKKWFSFFWYFLRIFEKKYLIFWKNYAIILPLTEQNFTTWSGFLTIFHNSWVPWGLWKIAKPFKNCTWWSV